MKLVFIHGWGFDASFWDRLTPLLSEFEQEHVDLGFFGNPTNLDEIDAGDLLVGHSLGFVHGMRLIQDWGGWVAINSFPRFLHSDSKAGCVAPAVLRTMHQQLTKNPERTLTAFYELIGAAHMASAPPDLDTLSNGLDELRDTDIGDILKANTKPGFVLAAEKDPLVPAEASETMTGTNSTIRWHPTGGHLLPRNEAGWCAEAIRDFIDANWGNSP